MVHYSSTPSYTPTQRRDILYRISWRGTNEARMQAYLKSYTKYAVGTMWVSMSGSTRHDRGNSGILFSSFRPIGVLPRKAALTASTHHPSLGLSSIRAAWHTYNFITLLYGVGSLALLLHCWRITRSYTRYASSNRGFGIAAA